MNSAATTPTSPSTIKGSGLDQVTPASMAKLYQAHGGIGSADLGRMPLQPVADNTGDVSHTVMMLLKAVLVEVSRP